MTNNIASPFIKHAKILAPILLLAFYVRADNVGNWPVRWDEAFSVWEAQMDFVVGTRFTAQDVHPPLYFWLLHVWARLAGSSEIAIRGLSVLLSLSTVAVIYLLTLRMSKQRLAAAIAAVLIAVSPFHIEWSQDARNYSLAMLFVSLVVYAYWSWRARLLVISGLGMMLTHYFGAIVIGILVLHRVIYWRELQYGRRRFFQAVAAIAALFALWALYAFPLIRRDPSFATFQPVFAYQLTATLFTVGKDTHLDSYILPVLLISAIYFFGLLLAWRDSRLPTAFVLLGCLLPAAVVSALALPFIPLHVNALQARHYSVFAPFVFAGYGIGFAAMLKRRRLRPAAAVILVGLLVFYGALIRTRADARYFRDDYRSMMAAIAALTDQNDLVFFTSVGRKPVVYYHLGRVGYDVPRNSRAEPINVIGIPRKSDDVAAMMQRVFAGIPRFWLIEIEAHHDEQHDARTNWLNANYHRIYHIDVGWNAISLFSSDENDGIPNIDTLIPPVISEARPGDQVRIGVPAGVRVDLVHSGQVVDSMIADSWMLHQFDVYAYYFNGRYELRVAEESYPFVITHSREFPGG